MAFVDELNARFGEQNIIRWTNPDSKTATTANSTIIAAALVDTSGEFRKYAGVLYDETDNRMIGIACDLAVYHMRKRYADAGMFQGLRDAAIIELKELRKVTHSDTVLADTTLVNEIPIQRSTRSAFDSGVLKLSGFPTHAAPGTEDSGGYID